MPAHAHTIAHISGNSMLQQLHQGWGFFLKWAYFAIKDTQKIKESKQKLTNVETAIFEENIRKYVNWKEDNIMLAKIS